MNYKAVNFSILTLIIVVPLVLGLWLSIIAFQFKLKETDAMAIFICSELFISKKNTTEIRAIIPEKFSKNFTTELNPSANNVQIKFLNFFTSTAKFRNDLGCYIGSDSNRDKDLAIAPDAIDRNSTQFNTDIIPEIEAILERELRLGSGIALLVWYNGNIVGETYFDDTRVTQKFNGYDFGYILSYLLHQRLIDEQQLSIQSDKLFTAWENDERSLIKIANLYNPFVDFELPNIKGLLGKNYLKSRHHYGSLHSLLPFIKPNSSSISPIEFSPIKADLLAAYLSSHIQGNNYSLTNFFNSQLGQAIDLPQFSFQTDANGYWIPDMTYGTAREWLSLAKFLYDNNRNHRLTNETEDAVKTNQPIAFAQHNLLAELNQSSMIRTTENKELTDAWLLTARDGQIIAISKSKNLIIMKFSDSETEPKDKFFTYTYNQINQILE